MDIPFVLNKRQNVINNAPTTPIVSRSGNPLTICDNVDDVTFIPSSTLGMGAISTSNGKALTKVEMFQSQSISIAPMGKEMVISNDDQRLLIKVKMEINIFLRKGIKLSNFKTTKDLGMLTKDEFKAKIKEMLDL
jgi:hypothetical protein